MTHSQAARAARREAALYLRKHGVRGACRHLHIRISSRQATGPAWQAEARDGYTDACGYGAGETEAAARRDAVFSFLVSDSRRLLSLYVS